MTASTSDAADIARIADFAAGLGNVEEVELLPFHQLGRFKWQRLGIAYELGNTPPPSPAQMESAAGMFQSVGLRVH